MKKKYVIALSVIGILLTILGVTYAYFTAKTLSSGEGASITATTVTLEEVNLAVDGTIEFNDPDILPGHQNISGVKVTGYGENKIVTYNLVWIGTNTFNTPLKYTIYKTVKEEQPKVTCTKLKSGNANYRKYYEECKHENFENLGDPVNTGTITKAEESKKFEILLNEAIKGTQGGNSVYYYVLLEFPDTKDNQNEPDLGGSFDGVVTVEEASNPLADLTISKIYKQIDGEYQETDKEPEKSENYTLDIEQSQSSCTNDAEISWNNKNYSLNVNLKQTNTVCDLYFKKIPTAKDTLVSLGIDKVKDAPSNSEFNKTVCANNTNNEAHNSGNCDSSISGIFKGTEMVNDEPKDTYYYRGTVDNNWVQFANYWWRIIRINGNGSIRLIYSGSSKPSGDGRWADKTDSQLSETSAFNGTDSDSRYVGYMYGESTDDYKSTHTNKKESTIKIALDQWYKSNMTSFTDKLDGSAGFCNDREPYDGSSSSSKVDKSGHGYGKVETYYGSYIRTITNNKPSFDCTQKSNDLFTTQAEQGEGNGKLTYPIGLITADEVEFAGGKDYNNYGYWLYTGNPYWTVSPSHWLNHADVFFVRKDGNLTYAYVYVASNGVRPVINLKADTEFQFEKNEETQGTINNPYVVVG